MMLDFHCYAAQCCIDLMMKLYRFLVRNYIGTILELCWCNAGVRWRYKCSWYCLLSILPERIFLIHLEVGFQVLKVDFQLLAIFYSCSVLFPVTVWLVAVTNWHHCDQTSSNGEKQRYFQQRQRNYYQF